MFNIVNFVYSILICFSLFIQANTGDSLNLPAFQLQVFNVSKDYSEYQNVVQFSLYQYCQKDGLETQRFMSDEAEVQTQTQEAIVKSNQGTTQCPSQSLYELRVRVLESKKVSQESIIYLNIGAQNLSEFTQDSQKGQQTYQVEFQECGKQQAFIGPIQGYQQIEQEQIKVQQDQRNHLQQPSQGIMGKITVMCRHVIQQKQPQIQDQVDQYYNSLLHKGESVIKGANMRLKSGREQNTLTDQDIIKKSLDNAKEQELVHAHLKKQQILVTLNGSDDTHDTKIPIQQLQKLRTQQKLKEKAKQVSASLKEYKAKSQKERREQLHNETLGNESEEAAISQFSDIFSNDLKQSQRNIQQIGSPPKISVSPSGYDGSTTDDGTPLLTPSPTNSPPKSPYLSSSPSPNTSPTSNISPSQGLPTTVQQAYSPTEYTGVPIDTPVSTPSGYEAPEVTTDGESPQQIDLEAPPPVLDFEAFQAPPTVLVYPQEIDGEDSSSSYGFKGVQAPPPATEIYNAPSESITQQSLASFGYEPVSLYQDTPTGMKVYDGQNYQPVQSNSLNFEETTQKLTQAYQNPYLNVSDIITQQQDDDNQDNSNLSQNCRNLCENLAPAQGEAIQDLIKSGLIANQKVCDLSNIQCTACGMGQSCVSGLTISILDDKVLQALSKQAMVLPPSIVNLNTVTKLSIANIPLVGNASFISAMPLKFLQISNTKLGGAIPSFSQPQSVQAILLPKNQFSSLGSLASLEYFQTLQQLDLSGNQISDQFPELYVNSNSPPLSYFDISNNMIFGSIKDFGFDKLNQLFRFSVSNNKITGTIPASLQGILSIEQFCLDSNNFEGDLNLQAPRLSQLLVSDNPNLCISEASLSGIETGAKVSIFANALGSNCIPGEPNVAVGFFSDTNCGVSNDQKISGSALTYLSGSNYVCDTTKLYDPKNRDPASCSTNCLEGVNSILVYSGVKADFLDCDQKAQVMPSVNAQKQAQCIPLQDKNALKFINIEYGQVKFSEEDTGQNDDQDTPSALSIISLPFTAKVTTEYLNQFADKKVVDGYSATVIDTSRYSSNKELQQVIQTINYFKTIISTAASNNQLPKPEVIRVSNVYFQNESQTIEALAIFNGQTDPILANSFLSMLKQNAINILGPNSVVSSDVDFTKLGVTSEDKSQYTINTKIVPQDFSLFTAINQQYVNKLSNQGVTGWPIDVLQGCKDFVQSQASKVGGGANQELMQDVDQLCNASSLLLYMTNKQNFDLRIVQAPVIKLESAKQIQQGSVLINNAQTSNLAALGAAQLVWAEKFSVTVKNNVQIVFAMVAPGVIKQDGALNLPSQVFAVLVDSRQIKPVITSNQRFNTIDNPQPSFYINYGRTLVNKNSGRLFQITGVASMEGFYNPTTGQIQVICTVKNSSQANTIKVKAIGKTAKDLSGNTNEEASFAVRYAPPSESMNLAYAGAYGASWSASAASSIMAVSQGTFTGHELTTGGLSSLFLIWATQKFMYKRQMAVPNLPEIYKQCYTRLEWVIFDIPLPWAKIFDVSNNFNNVTQSHSQSVFGRNLKSLGALAEEPRIQLARQIKGTRTQSNIWDIQGAEYFQKSHYYIKNKTGQIKFRNLLGFNQEPEDGYQLTNRCNLWGPTYRMSQPTQQEQQQIIAANSVYTSRRKLLSSFMANLHDDLEFEVHVDGLGRTYGYKSLIMEAERLDNYVVNHYFYQGQQTQVSNNNNVAFGRSLKSNDQSSIVSLRNYGNTQEQQSMLRNLSSVPRTNPMTNFQRIIFWTLCVFVVVLVLHLSILLVFIIIGKHPPDILLLPRFELTISLLLIPPSVGACASLFVGNATEIVLGVIIFLVLPFLLLFVYYGYLWFYISFKTPNKRKANYLVELTQEQEAQVQLLNEGDVIGKSINKKDNPFEKIRYNRENNYQVIAKLDRKYLFQKKPNNVLLKMLQSIGQWFSWILIGPKGLVGQWVATQHPDSKYMAKYGSLFEDCQGRQVMRYGATYDIIPSRDGSTFQVDRGQLLVLHESPIIKMGRLHLYRTDFAVYGLLMEASKISLFAMLVRSINVNYSPGQVIGMMVISIIHGLYIRIFQPFRTRKELLIAQCGNLADIGTFICALLLLGDYAYVNNTYRRRVGVAMIVMEFISLFGYFAERLSRISYTLYRLCIHWMPWERKKGKLLQELVKRELLQSSDLLATKHLDRWMRLALGRGLRGTNLRRGEQNFRQVVGRGIARKFNLIRSISSLRSTSSLIKAQGSQQLKKYSSNNSDMFQEQTPRSEMFNTFHNEGMKMQGDSYSDIRNSMSDKLDSQRLYPDYMEYSDNSSRRKLRQYSGDFNLQYNNQLNADYINRISQETGRRNNLQAVQQEQRDSFYLPGSEPHSSRSNITNKQHQQQSQLGPQQLNSRENHRSYREGVISGSQPQNRLRSDSTFDFQHDTGVVQQESFGLDDQRGSSSTSSRRNNIWVQSNRSSQSQSSRRQKDGNVYPRS